MKRGGDEKGGKYGEMGGGGVVGTGIAVCRLPGLAWCGVGTNERDRDMFTTDANSKKCATCEYWGGKREINRSSPKRLGYEGGSFPCELKTSKTGGSSSCPKYKKWEHLP